MLSIIVAKAKNNIIGKDNTMLWKLPDDLKRFKELTGLNDEQFQMEVISSSKF